MSDDIGEKTLGVSLLAEDEVFLFPLSFAQQRLWLLDRLEPNSTVYNVPVPLRLLGPLDISALEQSFSEIVRRHEVLRATFQLQDDAPVQIVHPADPVQMAVRDLSCLSPELREHEARQLALQDAQSPFDLSRGPLFRASLLKLDEQDHVLLLSFHHIIFDGWSGRVLLRDLMSAYNAIRAGQPAQLPDLPLQYADYAIWQRDFLSGERLERQLAYWKRQLAGAPRALELPTDHARPARQSFRGAKTTCTLPAALVQALNNLSQGEGTTLFMTLLAGLSVLLARYSGQEEIVVGSPIAGRNRIELENLIGFFVNTLALRTDVSGNPSFRQLLAQVRETTLNAYAHQDLPFEKLVEELKPERDLGRNPIFQVMFAFQKTPSESELVSGLRLSPFDNGDRASSKFDLTVTATEKTDGIRLTFEYSTDLFLAESMERMQRHFQNLLEAIAADPDSAVYALPLMKAEEREQIVHGWNQTAADYDRNGCIHTAFEQQSAKTPRQTALVYGHKKLSFRELNEHANQLAHYLVRKGIQPGMRVGIALERSPEMVIGLLAVLKVGAAYVPLDPSYPTQRLAFMIEDSGVSAVLTNANSRAQLPPAISVNFIAPDDEAHLIGKESAANLGVGLSSTSAAYLVYTSGSTGKPKGVVGTHRGAMNRFSWMWRTYPFQTGEVCCQKTTLGFVDSIWEIFGPLLQGVPNVIIPDDAVLEPAKFIAILAEHRVTRIVVVPSLLRALLEFRADLAKQLPRLKLWSCSGEALPADLAQAFLLAFPHAKLLNIYGSSEVAADATWHEVSVADRESIPVGRPLANTQVYVLDCYLNPVPAGVYGKIYVGGDGLAQGYWNRPELTAERFIPNRLAPQVCPRLYDTGDNGRFQPNGALQYRGRADDQVKIRGFRIELREIESVLRQQENVQQAIVVARDFGGEQRLVAYATAKTGTKLAAADLRLHLEQVLPAYMLPATFVLLEQFPLTPSGKINRLALPEPGIPETSTLIAPRDSVEEGLIRIWERVLGLPRLGVKDNFFEVGGHSLLAVRLISEIRQEMGQEIPLATLFQSATIEALAKVLRHDSGPDHQMVVAVQPEGSKPPIFGVVTPGANPLGYVALARHLGKDQPFYGIQGPGPKLRRPYTFQEFEELAADYIRAMKTIQPHGPYYLTGMCEGARIAFDMARLLENQGEKIGLLAILDTWVLENSQNRFLWKIDYYRTRIKKFWKGSRTDKWRELRRWTENRYGTTRQAKLWPKAYWPGKDFVPAVYSGKITVFKVPKQPFFYVNDPLMGWGTRTTGEVELQIIDSRHLAILREPYVRTLAPMLSECLARARESFQTQHAFAAHANQAAAQPLDSPASYTCLP